MRRSLATTFITLLPIASLLLFGGATLKDFAFALFVGIGLGAISTFFVATPFLTVLMERSDEFKRRTGTEEDVVLRGTARPVAEPEEEAEEVLVAAAPSSTEPPPTAAPAPAGDGAVSKSQAKRERRRQRRRTRPHGRAR